jgi:glutamyl-tRNA synthetase
MTTVTRFPPSPTGYLHIGGARTALFNWLYARKTGGEMVLRIEDTDRARSTQDAIDVILDAMKWLGLTWNQGPFYQTRRFDRYAEVVEQLLAQDSAYYCFCTRERLDDLRNSQRKSGEKPRYDGCCREKNRIPEANEDAVIRFKNPQTGSVVFDDVVRGRVEVANQEMDDLIISRTDGTPTYNLTVVVDDIDMGISHVIRGEDHINNTPRQINIFLALQAELPVFAHVPLILGEDGQRLSKRHGAVSVLEYRDMGILPEALLNYLVRLGWSYGDQEIFDIDEMIELFDITDINKSPAAFNLEKLLWINQQYIINSPQRRLATEMAKILNKRGIGLCNGPEIDEVVEVMRERARTLEEMADKIKYLYTEIEEYDPAAVKKHIKPDSGKLLQAVAREFGEIVDWSAENINQGIKNVMQQQGVKMGELAQPLRIALSGSAATPSIDITVRLVGKERTVERIEKAVEFMEKAINSS